MSEDAKRKIIDTLMELSLHVDIEKITVSQLVKKCNISRTLFYYYYQDIYDVLEDIITTGMDKIVAECIKFEEPRDSIRCFFQHYIEWVPLFKKVLHTKFYEKAEYMITQTTKKYLRIMLTHKAGDIAIRPDDAEFLIDFMSSGITVYFFQHCEKGKIDIDKFSDQFYLLIISRFNTSL
ncbi:TetR/AcrR family transcriptional regulator [Paenibacillus kribbensis]|uniref:TetR/AcrR family transcriptional regulator n=1 Tax=Paenibacillus kribbensis TaxID=172713 RepID=UPI002DBF8210|nr:TetR/AcrR family transcriptional regulator [Paenibacillus kribbensis]MEC0232801.1 TetR/AcrR family transcriptional regulator [Paenibacillus kribbensis]